MINKENGDVIIDEHVVIKGTMTLKQVSLLLGKSWVSTLKYKKEERYKADITISHNKYIIEFIFFNKVLRSVHLLNDDPSLNEWSDANEKERKKLHDRILLNELGHPPYEYKWGTIRSVYIPQHCESSIIITWGTEAKT